MSKGLQGQVALVTGGSGSIGSATVQALAERGADVVIHYHRNRKGAERVAQDVRDRGRRAVVLQADIRYPQAVKSLVEEAQVTLGPIAILVNNAGIQHNNLIVTMQREQWDEVIAVNLCGPLYFCQALVPEMAKRGYGRIINIASITGLVGQKLRTNYGASKRGLLGLTRALARRFARRGVLVNAIAPQVVEGGLSRDSSLWELQEIKNMAPLERFGKAAEIAALVAFLASQESSYLTGTVLNITGGLVTWD